VASMTQVKQPQSNTISAEPTFFHDNSRWLILCFTLGVRVVAGSNPATPTNS
jgi:hypothetical protein